jgi:hypothetical protein
MKKKIKIVIINALVIICLVIALEMFLRFIGEQTIHQGETYKPGWKTRYKRICQEILEKNFEIYDDFFTDNNGIFRANPHSSVHLQKKLQGININPQGFRGNEFKYTDTPKVKILLIGDSFTWGKSAKPLTKCFADLIQGAGYYVYNAGIPGTDPVQYAKIAQKYTLLLKPQVVIVCLYLGNDLRPIPHPIQPNKNLHYKTSVGFLRGYDDSGKYFKNAQEAINYLKKKKCGYCENIWDSLIYKTVLGKVIFRIQHLMKKKYLATDTKREWVRDALSKIQQVCRTNGSDFMLFLIPVVKRNQRTGHTLKENLNIFIGFQYYYPQHIEDTDYHLPPNNHFNNQGHWKFANLIIKTLSQRGYLPLPNIQEQ